MRVIAKQAEPATFVTWKQSGTAAWTPTYGDLRGQLKSDVQESLLREQYFNCCYCEQRVGAKSSHIEHFRPQGTPAFSHLQIDYLNLHASCPRSELAGAPKHCGPAKNDWFDSTLLVSPSWPNCAAHFKYLADGAILPSDDPMFRPAAAETIERLQLGIPKLTKMRRKAVEAIENILGADSHIRQAELNALRTPNAAGELPPFLSTLEHLLT